MADITKIKDSAEYLTELYGTGPDGMPSFYEFLEKMRGIPKETFSQDQYMALALQSEMMYYSMFLQDAQKTAFMKNELEQYKEELQKLPLDDLILHTEQIREKINAEANPTTRDMLGYQLSLAEAELTKSSREIAEQASQ